MEQMLQLMPLYIHLNYSNSKMLQLQYLAGSAINVAGVLSGEK